MKNEINFNLNGLSKAQIVKAINTNFYLKKQDILCVFETPQHLLISLYDGIAIWDYAIPLEEIDVFLTTDDYNSFIVRYLG